MPLRPLGLPPAALQQLLQLKGGVPWGFWDEVVPVIDIEKYLLDAATLEWDTETFTVTGNGFQGIQVPQGENWIVYVLGSITNLLAAGEILRIQSAVQTLGGQTVVTDVSGLALAGTGGTTQGGVGQFLYPLPLRAGERAGFFASTVTGSVDVTVSVLHTTQRV